MPAIKTNFSLKDADVERLQKAILNYGSGAEEVINNYLKNVGGKKIADSVTRFIPVSDKEKSHAKFSQWFEMLNYNLAVVIGNKTTGKKDKSFYYLYYPATGTGTSKRKGKNDFMGRGLDYKYDEIVGDLLAELEKNIGREGK